MSITIKPDKNGAMIDNEGHEWILDKHTRINSEYVIYMDIRYPDDNPWWTVPNSIIINDSYLVSSHDIVRCGANPILPIDLSKFKRHNAVFDINVYVNDEKIEYTLYIENKLNKKRPTQRIIRSRKIRTDEKRVHAYKCLAQYNPLHSSFRMRHAKIVRIEPEPPKTKWKLVIYSYNIYRDGELLWKRRR